MLESVTFNKGRLCKDIPATFWRYNASTQVESYFRKATILPPDLESEKI
jgi:hypothetical protein